MLHCLGQCSSGIGAKGSYGPSSITAGVQGEVGQLPVEDDVGIANPMLYHGYLPHFWFPPLPLFCYVSGHLSFP